MYGAATAAAAFTNSTGSSFGCFRRYSLGVLLVWNFCCFCHQAVFALQVGSFSSATTTPRRSFVVLQHRRNNSPTTFFGSQDECNELPNHDDDLSSLSNNSIDQQDVVSSRYVCLLKDYQNVEGPYFSACLEELLELRANDNKQDDENERRRRMAILTTQKDFLLWKKEEQFLSDLESSLDLGEPPMVLLLDDCNPLQVEDIHDYYSIIWLSGTYNAFWTRHLLRTSGLDRWIQQRCGSSMASVNNNSKTTITNNALFVGEGTGALVVGKTMNAARLAGNDPSEAPELQAFGLGLVREGVVFRSSSKLKDATAATSTTEEEAVTVLQDDQVWVWGQPLPEDDKNVNQVATKFVFSPNRKGTIESMKEEDPLPPIISSEDNIGGGGVACYGEPSIDPSRAAQSETIGDSEWWE